MTEPDNHDEVQQHLEWWHHGMIEVGAMSELNAPTHKMDDPESSSARESIEMPPGLRTKTRQVTRRKLPVPGLVFAVKFMVGARGAGV